ncbi:MAG: nucleotidyl transferase AbiEii/AbiGii toxin family protein [Acidimicrobiales bacterium]
MAALLDHARDENDDPLFVLKGGAALELRLGLRARATKDFDTTYRHALAGMLDRLDESLRHGHSDFTATRTEAEPVTDTGAQRLDIKLAYRGRSWATVRLEIAAAEGVAGREIDRVAGMPLDFLGLDVPAEVPCVSVRYQMAQKLHACTEVPGPNRTNDRFRDLVDLLLLEELIEDEEWSSVRAACEELFSLRAMHAWPPDVTVFPSWPEGYRALATELDFPITDVEQAAEAVRRLIARVHAA